MEKNAKIYIAGHSGLIGSRVVDELTKQGYLNLVTRDHASLDLMRQAEVERFFDAERPQFVILLAARVGGIQANISYPAEFIYENIAIQTNVIHSAYKYNVKKLLFSGTSCSYPRQSPQPVKEEYLLSGYLEPTNEAYAIAKIAGIKMCQSYNRQYGTDFISALLTNTYGPGDNFDPVNSHVIPALIKKFHEAKINREPSVVVWGTGDPRRQFIYVDDIADACIFLMNHYDDSDIINVAVDYDITIRELVYIVKEVVDYGGEVVFDRSKNDGIPRKMLDPSKLKTLGWQARTPLVEGIKRTYEWYLGNLKKV